ncbi:MAG: AAA family ATPase [Patulibacter sp.]
MKITHVRASNWRNFKSLDFRVEDRLFVVGPNAAGKSNLIDLFRFVGDIAAPGGGLAAALEQRGGLSKARSLVARNYKNGRLEIDFQLSDANAGWRYRLAVGGQKGGKNRPVVVEERVEKNGEIIVQRPNADDRDDPERLTQTHLEQIAANQAFRSVAEHFAKTRYFHLVPQVIRDPGVLSGAPGDMYGANFVAQINATRPQTQRAWLRRIEAALQSAVPEFETLKLEVDATGRPHLVAGYRNWRSKPTGQSEADFSDGTLRLIGLLWILVSAPATGGMLLLEEPELSLNSAIIRMLPTVFATAQRDRSMQVVVTTHAPELLDDEGVLPREVLVLQPTGDGTTATLLSDIDLVADQLAVELPKSEIVEALVSPQDLSGLVAAGRSKRG